MSGGDDPHVCTTILSPQMNISNNSRLAAVFVREGYLWDNGKILTYTFLDGSPKQHKKVVDTIQEWTYYANVTFELKEKDDGKALIRISFCNNLGDWSFVGQKIEEEDEGRTMNLASVLDSDICLPLERSVILHEWGHTLGLLHEHQSIAMKREFTFNTDNVKEYYRRSHPTLDDTFIKENILDDYLESDMSNWSEVDTQSIMIYSIDKSFTYEGSMVGMNTELSDKDKAYMVINYPRDEPHEKASAWTLKHALTLANVPEDVSQSWNTQDVRDKYRNYVQSLWKKDWINITVEGPFMKAQRPSEIFRITTKTNFENFQPVSQVDRQYSEVKELCRILNDSGFEPPKLQKSRKISIGRASRSRRDEIEQVLQNIAGRKKELSTDSLSELHRFLHVKGSVYPTVNDTRPSSSSSMEAKDWLVDRGQELLAIFDKKRKTS